MHRNTMTTDHPAWRTLEGGRLMRLVSTGTAAWSAVWDGDAVAITPLAGSSGRQPAAAVTLATDLPDTIPAELGEALAGLDIVHRLSNPWLWDAITTAVLRQVVKAPQARAKYERWCCAYGAPLPAVPGALRPVPDPLRVLALADDEFARVGSAFNRTTLQAAARAYLRDGESWAQLPPAELVGALVTIPGIGAWIARAAAADYTGDYSIYPHGDLAVRTWAAKAAPGTDWPADADDFAAAWCAMASTPHHLHALSLLTLTWGSHARTAGADRSEERAA